MFENVFEFIAGTAVASEKSTSSNAVQPLNVLASTEDDDLLSFLRYTVLSDVHPLNVSLKAPEAVAVVRLDKSTVVNDVHPWNARYRD